jgi:hypothetical protein
VRRARGTTDARLDVDARLDRGRVDAASRASATTRERDATTRVDDDGRRRTTTTTTTTDSMDSCDGRARESDAATRKRKR